MRSSAGSAQLRPSRTVSRRALLQAAAALPLLAGASCFPETLRRSVPGSKVAWEYQASRPDVDHFNRDYKPELARGGTDICRLDPGDGSIVSLSGALEGRWDFRAAPSPDGSLIAFCRAETGRPPGLWVMRADGSNQRLLTSGIDGRGADHPRWIPSGG